MGTVQGPKLFSARLFHEGCFVPALEGPPGKAQVGVWVVRNFLGDYISVKDSFEMWIPGIESAARSVSTYEVLCRSPTAG